MPNYCECHVRIYNDDEKRLEEIKTFLQGDEAENVFDFNKLIPYPTEWAEADKARRMAEEAKLPYHQWPSDGYNRGGCDWCIKNWGTRWPACDPKIAEQSNWYIQYQFDTAWSPPLPVMDKLAETFPDSEITLEYYERGMSFCGSIRWEDGKRTHETRGEYHGWRGG